MLFVVHKPHLNWINYLFPESSQKGVAEEGRETSDLGTRVPFLL